MNQTAQLFEIDQVRRFKKFWDTLTNEEREEVYAYTRAFMGDVHEDERNNKSTKELNKQADNVIDFLNRKVGKNFRKVETHRVHIRNRLKSGITEQQLKSIIIKKMREWENTDMEQYLRPATLFNATNTENYLGELDG